jgi:hypothetical protein
MGMLKAVFVQGECLRVDLTTGVAGALVDLSAKLGLAWSLNLADMPTTWRLSDGSAWRYEVRRAL